MINEKISIDNNVEAEASDSVYAYLLFLLSPLLSIIISLKRYRSSWAKNIIWLYSAFFGFTFVIGNATSDVNRYKANFTALLTVNYSFWGYIEHLANSESSFDYMQPLIMYLMSFVTNDFRIVLAVFGFIFGFFYSRNIWNIISFIRPGFPRIAMLLIVVFSIIYAVWDINVLRFTIAAHMFFYGTFNNLVRKKKWPLQIAILSITMHYTMVLSCIVLLLYKILGNWPRIYFALLILSLGVSELDMKTVQGYMTFLPQNLQEDSKDYVNEDYKELREDMKEQNNFRGKYYQPALVRAIEVLLIFVFIRRNNWLVKNKVWYGLFNFILLFFSIFNILSSIPVMNRFVFLACLFALAFLAVYFVHNNHKPERNIFTAMAPLMIFYFIVKFRVGMEFTGFFTVVGNPLTALFNDGDTAFINFLK